MKRNCYKNKQTSLLTQDGMPPLNQAVTLESAPETFCHTLQIGWRRRITPKGLQWACMCPQTWKTNPTDFRKPHIRQPPLNTTNATEIQGRMFRFFEVRAPLGHMLCSLDRMSKTGSHIDGAQEKRPQHCARCKNSHVLFGRGEQNEKTLWSSSEPCEVGMAWYCTA